MYDDWSDPEEMEEHEEYEACLHRFEQMVESDGHAFFDEDEYIYIIDHFMTEDKMEMAAKAIRQSLERYPDNLYIRLRRIGMLSANHETEKALRELRRTDREYPDADGICLYEEAVLYLDMQQLDEAEAKFNAVLALPKAELEEVLQDPNFYNDLADLHASKGNLIQALVAKQEAISRKAAPISEIAYITGQLNAEGQWNEALKLYESRTEADPLSAMDWLVLGKIRMDAGQYSEAREALHNVQAISGEESEATIELAAIQALTGNLPECEEELEQYFKTTGTPPQQQSKWYGQIAQYAFDRNMFSSCLRLCQKAIDTNGEEMFGHLLKALALGELGEYGQGVEELEKCRRIQPDNFDALLLTAEYQLQLGHSEEAGELFHECCRRFPEQDKTWLSYATYLIRTDHLNEAIYMLIRAIALRNNTAFIYRLSYCFFLKGDATRGLFYLHLAYTEDADGLAEFLDYDSNLMNITEIISFLNEINYYQ